MELCVPDGDFSAPFHVDWLKVVHMPFKVFDREGMIIPLSFQNPYSFNFHSIKAEIEQYSDEDYND